MSAVIPSAIQTIDTVEMNEIARVRCRARVYRNPMWSS
jgi:hypothetical protein